MAETPWKHTHVGGEPVVHKKDLVNSISSRLGLTRYDGTLAAVVESPRAKDQISALVDLLELDLSSPSPNGTVALLLDQPSPEALGALQTLRATLQQRTSVVLCSFDGSGWAPIADTPFNAGDAGTAHYETWPALLAARLKVPDLLTELVAAASLPQLRAYPQLSSKGEWSLRLEGLEIGRISANGGQLGVGQVGKTGGVSAQRAAWTTAVGTHDPIPVAPGSVRDAATTIKAFARHWDAIARGQNEHALESRILRGAVPVTIGGTRLQLIRPDKVVSSGSQFPTKWGPGGRARYLDALLCDGRTPWAVEIKVNRGEGEYYRHAVAQVVLYREFIRRATPLHCWFHNLNLEATLCRAAIVVPEFDKPKWRERLRSLCELFDVDLVVVDSQSASWDWPGHPAVAYG